jgi:PqqD family protein of HPr-rel-A system
MINRRDDTLWGMMGERRLVFRTWNDGTDVVCYDTASGDTHLLSALAAETLRQLQARPALRVDALASHVAGSFGLNADEAFVSSLEEILSEFARRGVIAQT